MKVPCAIATSRKNFSYLILTVGVVVKDDTNGAGGLRFDSRAGQIGHIVANRQTLYLLVKTATSDNNIVWNTQPYRRLRSDR